MFVDFKEIFEAGAVHVRYRKRTCPPKFCGNRMPLLFFV